MNAGFKDILPHGLGTLHPHLFERLFTHKRYVFQVFSDILGLYGIDHVAITYINKKQEILTLSSTPALEFNLFKSQFWRFDQTYQARWYQQCSSASWDMLYDKPHVDVLYYLKQIKPRYPFGFSLAHAYAHGHMIYSLASHGQTPRTREQFKTEHAHFGTIGHYCTQSLFPLLLEEA